MKNVYRKTKGGFSLIEVLFYIALMAILSVLVINAIITMTKSFKETTIKTELKESSAIMEKISREIKQANSISTITSTDLKLNTTDEGGAAKTVEFLLSGTNLQYLENNVLTGNLNTPNISVTGITFTQVSTAEGQAVKVSLTVRSASDSLSRTFDFYNTLVLRGSYAN